MKNKGWKYLEAEVSEKVIRELENELSTSFPKDYRSFITKHSGASPVANLISLSNKREVIMDRLLSVEPDADYNVLIATESFGNDDFIRLIPFGEDPYGNLFCFRYKEKKYIDIVFWDHEYKKIHEICKTFCKFLNLLHSEH